MPAWRDTCRLDDHLDVGARDQRVGVVGDVCRARLRASPSDAAANCSAGQPALFDCSCARATLRSATATTCRPRSAAPERGTSCRTCRRRSGRPSPGGRGLALKQQGMQVHPTPVSSRSAIFSIPALPHISSFEPTAAPPWEPETPMAPTTSSPALTGRPPPSADHAREIRLWRAAWIGHRALGEVGGRACGRSAPCRPCAG